MKPRIKLVTPIPIKIEKLKAGDVFKEYVGKNLYSHVTVNNVGRGALSCTIYYPTGRSSNYSRLAFFSF